MDKRDLFLSHSSDDVEAARAVRAIIEEAGYSVWMAPDDIAGAGTWAEQILAAIDSTDALIVLVSSHANGSTHVSREVNLALARRRPVLPIRIEDIPPTGALEYLLSLVQRVDAFPPPIEAHHDQVVRRVEMLLGRTSTSTSTGSEPAKSAEHPGDAATRGPGAPVGIGSVVDDFTVEALLGEGGMGTVYRARQGEPNRAVALKVLRTDHADDETYRRRFLSEKDALATLEHPSIVPIYAAGEDGGVLYIAMRLVDGRDLNARILAQGRLSLRETLDVLRPIADAVDYAHAAGIVHRDLKPSNIILDARGRPYLTDFGLGRRIASVSRLTEQGVAVGTLEFMAPEQFQGVGDGALANRIDVYALGCVAYTCLTGHPPFTRPTPTEMMHAHVSEPPPPARSVVPELPAVVDVVLQRALAKDPAARFGSATELVTALEAAFASAGAGQTNEVVIVGRLPQSAIGSWLRAHASIAVIGGSLGAIGLVMAIAAWGGGGSLESAAPSSTLEVVPSPTAAGDTSPPSGGSVSIVSGEPGLEGEVTTDINVTVEVASPTDPSGVTSYIASNSPTRPPLTEAQAIVDSFAWRLAEGGLVAGPRTVYVWFADGTGNWTTQPREATIEYDNAPVIAPPTSYNTSGCNRDYDINLLKDVPTLVATDVDGGVEIAMVWYGDPNPSADGVVDFTTSIFEDRKGVSVRISGVTTSASYIFYFRVRDEAGVTRDGRFTLNVTCPT